MSVNSNLRSIANPSISEKFDIISSLPPEISQHILGLVATPQITSYVSKSWRANSQYAFTMLQSQYSATPAIVRFMPQQVDQHLKVVEIVKRTASDIFLVARIIGENPDTQDLSSSNLESICKKAEFFIEYNIPNIVCRYDLVTKYKVINAVSEKLFLGAKLLLIDGPVKELMVDEIAKKGDQRTLKKWLAREPFSQNLRDIALFRAAGHGHTDIVQMIFVLGPISQGIKEDATMYARFDGHREIVKTLEQRPFWHRTALEISAIALCLTLFCAAFNYSSSK